MRNKIDKILEWSLIVLMTLLLTDVLWQVLSRYVNKFLANNMYAQIPNLLYAFTDELAGFLLVWVALLGSAYATGKKQHLAIELLVHKLKPKGQKRLNITINVIILIFAIFIMIIGGVWLVYTRFYSGQVSAAMQLPIGFVYAILPISGIIISFYAINDLFFTNAPKA